MFFTTLVIEKIYYTYVFIISTVEKISLYARLILSICEKISLYTRLILVVIAMISLHASLVLAICEKIINRACLIFVVCRKIIRSVVANYNSSKRTRIRIMSKTLLTMLIRPKDISSDRAMVTMIREFPASHSKKLV